MCAQTNWDVQKPRQPGRKAVPSAPASTRHCSRPPPPIRHLGTPAGSSDPAAHVRTIDRPLNCNLRPGDAIFRQRQKCAYSRPPFRKSCFWAPSPGRTPNPTPSSSSAGLCRHVRVPNSTLRPNHRPPEGANGDTHSTPKSEKIRPSPECQAVRRAEAASPCPSRAVPNPSQVVPNRIRAVPNPVQSIRAAQ